MEKRKSFYINVVKGAAMFLMLWGHCIECCANGTFTPFDHPLFLGIYSFHMPLFMLVSGYLFFFSFRKRELKPLLIHRTQGLLQPIVLGGVLNQFFMVLLYKGMDWGATFLGGSLMPGLNTFWFLWCVLACSIVVSVACKVTRHWWLQGILLVLGSGFIILFPSPDLFLSMYPFFLLGFFYAKWEIQVPAWVRRLRYLSLAAFPVLVSFYETSDSFYITPVYNRSIGITASAVVDLYRTAVGLAGSLFVMTLLWEAVRWLYGRRVLEKLLLPLERMGKNSLQLYCISTALISGYLPVLYPIAAASIGYNVFEGRMWLYDFVFTPLLAAAYAVLIGLIIVILKKLRLHELIFRR